MCSKILVSALWWTKYIMRLFPNYLKRIICVSAPLFVFVLYSSIALYCFFLSLSSKFLSSASASFFSSLSLSLYATVIPPALSPSLYLDLFCLLSDFVCQPPPPTLTYTLANPVSLLSLSLHPFCWPPLAQCHTFSHKWSPLWFETHTRTHSSSPPKTSSAPKTLLIASLICTGVL